VRETGSSRLTDEQGIARVELPEEGPGRVVVRQLGYRFVERTIGRPATSDTLTIALARVAVVLEASTTRAASSCAATVDSATSALSLFALEQLRFAADQYERFRQTYPHDVRIVRRTVDVDVLRARGKIREENFTIDARDWGERYEPGGIVRRRGGRFSAAIPFVTMLADSLFWERHCLIAQGVQSQDSHRVVRLDFAPSPQVREPDWAGSVLLDSATSELRRIEFHLAGLDDDSDPKRLEGYITLTQASPSVARPDSVVAGWWRVAPEPGQEWGTPSVAQLLHLVSVRYKGAAPPDTTRPSP
jgi:hypothetical protein